jgi:hypothetical protein
MQFLVIGVVVIHAERSVQTSPVTIRVRSDTHKLVDQSRLCAISDAMQLTVATNPGSASASQQRFDLIHDLPRFRHAAGANLTAAQPALAGADKVQAVIAQLPDVSLDGGFGPHVAVHGRRDKHWNGRRQNCRAEQIVGQAQGESRDGASRCRSDDNQFRAAGESDVFTLRMLVRFKRVGRDAAVRQRFECGGPDEVPRTVGHDD